jgi:two-component system, CitB family, sensor kinase
MGAESGEDVNMASRGRRRRRLSSQIFAFQALILVATLLLGVLLALYGAQRRLDRDYEHRALGVAQTVATMPQIKKAIASKDRSGIVEQLAESVRHATGVTFVVVGDRHGIRYSHPDRSKIGKPVSTDPSGALQGRPVLAVQTGTLGRSARAKVPLRAPDGRIIGFVSVGVLEQKVHEAVIDAIPIVVLYAAVALGFGLLASLLLSRRLKRQTFGLELGEIVDLVKEREAMLHGIREGSLASIRRTGSASSTTRRGGCSTCRPMRLAGRSPTSWAQAGSMTC